MANSKAKEGSAWLTGRETNSEVESMLSIEEGREKEGEEEGDAQGQPGSQAASQEKQ